MLSCKTDKYRDLEMQDEKSVHIEAQDTESVRTIGQLYSRVLSDPSWSSNISDEGKHMWKVIRSLAANKKYLLIIETLVGTDGMTFGELKKKTNMDSNDINHALISLKENGLIIQIEDSKKYEVTKYCIALLATFTRLNQALEWLDESNKHDRCLVDDNFPQPHEEVPIFEKSRKIKWNEQSSVG